MIKKIKISIISILSFLFIFCFCVGVRNVSKVKAESIFDTSNWTTTLEGGDSVFTTNQNEINYLPYNGNLLGVDGISFKMRYNEYADVEGSSGVYIYSQEGVDWYVDYRAQANTVRVRRNGIFFTPVTLNFTPSSTDWVEYNVSWADGTNLVISVNGVTIITQEYATSYGDTFGENSKIEFCAWFQKASIKNISCHYTSFFGYNPSSVDWDYINWSLESDGITYTADPDVDISQMVYSGDLSCANSISFDMRYNSVTGDNNSSNGIWINNWYIDYISVANEWRLRRFDGYNLGVEVYITSRNLNNIFTTLPNEYRNIFVSWDNGKIVLKVDNIEIFTYDITANYPLDVIGTQCAFFKWNQNASLKNITFYTQELKNYSIVLNDANISPISYNLNSRVTLPIPVKYGYYFNGYTGANLTTPTKNVILPIGTTGNKTFTANWLKEYNINTISNLNGIVAVKNYGHLGEEVVINITPNADYSIKTVFVSDNITLTKIDENTYSFIMPEADVTLNVDFVLVNNIIGTNNQSFKMEVGACFRSYWTTPNCGITFGATMQVDDDNIDNVMLFLAPYDYVIDVRNGREGEIDYITEFELVGKVFKTVKPSIIFENEVVNFRGGIKNILDGDLNRAFFGIYYYQNGVDKSGNPVYIYANMPKGEKEQARSMAYVCSAFAIEATSKNDLYMTTFYLNKAIKNAVQVAMKKTDVTVDVTNIDYTKLNVETVTQYYLDINFNYTLTYEGLDITDYADVYINWLTDKSWLQINKNNIYASKSGVDNCSCVIGKLEIENLELTVSSREITVDSIGLVEEITEQRLQEIVENNLTIRLSINLDGVISNELTGNVVDNGDGTFTVTVIANNNLTGIVTRIFAVN